MLWNCLATARHKQPENKRPSSIGQNTKIIVTVSCSRRQINPQVGRVETTVALLGHFERLATPHIPRNTIVDVDRSVRKAVRVGKQLRKRLLDEGALALMSPKQDKELLTTPRADTKKLEVRAQDAGCINSANCAPMCSGVAPWRGQVASSIVSRTPSPVAPFCVDISLQAFRSFLDLIKGVRQIMSPVPATPARNPVGVEKADSSVVPHGKRTTCKAQTTDVIGPESCDEPTTGSPAKTHTFGKPSKHQHAALAANLDGFAVTPRSVQMEVLRGTLKLLKVNLFHLVRVAAMRRACRGNRAVKLSSEIGGDPLSSDGHESSRRETKGAGEEALTGEVVGDSDRLRPKGLHTGDGMHGAERDTKNTPSAMQGAKFEALGQKGYSSIEECDEGMHGVIRELHAELRTILEEPSADTDPETTDTVLAVQVRSVLCYYTAVLEILSRAWAV